MFHVLQRVLVVVGSTVLLVAGAVGAGGATATATTPANFSPYESSLYSSINAARAQAGLPGLSAAPGLTDVARGWASTMSASGTLSHNPNLANDVQASGAPGWTVAAENVGVGGPADGLFTAYMASPAHRDNILRSTVDSVGLGALRTPDGRVWDVMVFSNGYDPAYGASHTTPMPLAADGSTIGGPAPAPAPAPVPVDGPVGSLDAVSAGPGSIAVSGWALDPDTATSPTAVHVYVDGAGQAVLSAADPRPDVAAANPGAGAAHGYSASVAVDGGRHTVCAYAIDTGPGANTTLGCRTVTTGGAPGGSLDGVSVIGPRTLQVRGWSMDPGTAASNQVALYGGGQGMAVMTADASRPDVAAAYPAWGAAHGYSTTLDGAPAGSYQVCAYGLTVAGTGDNTTLGCRSVTVGGSPVGSLDGVVATAGSLTARGWTLDPDTATAIPVHVYVDGVLASISPADASRGDLAGPFSGFGTAHGYSVTVPVGPGAHRVCTYGIDTVAPGAPSLLGCLSVTS